MSTKLHDHYPEQYRIEPTDQGDIVVENPRNRGFDKNYWDFYRDEDRKRWEANGRPAINRTGPLQHMPR